MNWHDGRKFSGLLRRAIRIAQEVNSIQSELTDAFEQRYGATYSGVDADVLIDVLDCGQGEDVNAGDCDEIMSDLGYPLKETSK